MTLSGFLILTAGLLLAAPGAGQEERPQDDAGKLQGTWLTVSLVNDGKVLVGENVPPKPGPATTFAYEGNRWLRSEERRVGKECRCRGSPHDETKQEH